MWSDSQWSSYAKVVRGIFDGPRLSDSPDDFRWSSQFQMVLGCSGRLGLSLAHLNCIFYTHLGDQLQLVVSNVSTWLVSVTVLYVLRTLWLCHRLCLVLGSDDLRREEHVAVVGQGVCPAHSGFSYAQQVAVGQLFGIELLCLGWEENKISSSNRIWSIRDVFFFLSFFKLGHFHTVSEFIVGNNGNNEAVAVSVTQQTDETFACRSKLTQSCHRSQKLLVWNQ